MPRSGYATLARMHGEHATQVWLAGRVTIARRCRVVPIECVVRGYLEGSGWREYQATGSICGVKLPKGLRQCDKLPEPIFTPATKAAVGHDENISFEQARGDRRARDDGVPARHGPEYLPAAAAHALKHGIIIADTKFEFGVPESEVSRQGRTWVPPILIDEALTPDSSRFWPADDYQPGRGAEELRQAVPAGVPGRPGQERGMEQDAPGAGPPAGGGGRDAGALSRGVHEAVREGMMGTTQA